MGGFHVYDGDKPHCFLLPEDVIELVRAGLIVLPSTQDIQDRGKSDWVAKAIVIFQTIWFVTQCVARHMKHYYITKLEIATAAYTFLIVLVYLCWWDKPLGVKQPIRFPKHVYDPDTPVRFTRLERYEPLARMFHNVLLGELILDKPWNCSSDGLSDIFITDGLTSFPRVPRFFYGKPSRAQVYLSQYVTIVAAILFGAIHVFAWYRFPSPYDQQLWRQSSILTVALPFTWFITLVASRYSSQDIIQLISMFAFGFGFGAYLTFRIIIVSIACTSLRSLPPSAYKTVDWTTFIPHI